jgi:hypothetical protein
MAETSMRAATQIGTLEYQLFSEWYKSTYGQNPPKNDATIVSNPQYQFWQNVIRTSVWTPNMETQATVNRLGQGIVTTTPPPLDSTDMGVLPKGTKVVSINGYDFLEIDGQVVPDPIGKTGAEGMSEYQKSQLGLANRQWNTEQAQTGTNWLQNKELNKRLANVENYNREAQALMGTRTNWESDIRNEERQKMATQYDEWKNRLMGELRDSPRSWIQYQELKTKPNPYTPTPMGQGEEIQNTEQQLKLVEQQKQTVLKEAQKEVDNARESWSAVADRVTDAYDIIPPDAVIQAKSRYDNAVNQLNAVQESLSGRLASQTAQWEANKSVPGTEAYWATPRPIGEGGNMSVGSGDVPKPKGIPTPAWMASYLSKPTEYLTKQELPTLSGQSLTNITPTNLEQLKGFTDWTGQNTSDWLQQTQLQLPQNLNLGNRWRPARQR